MEEKMAGSKDGLLSNRHEAEREKLGQIDVVLWIQ